MRADRGSRQTSTGDGAITVILFRGGRHWATFWPRYLVLLLVATIPAGFLLGLLHRLHGGPVVWRIGLAIAIIWLGSWLTVLIRHRGRYARDLLVVTGENAIVAGGSRASLAIPLAEIHGISIVKEGSAATLFGIGDLILSAREPYGRVTVHGLAAAADAARVLRDVCAGNRADWPEPDEN